jgi:hypothetical protein
MLRWGVVLIILLFLMQLSFYLVREDFVTGLDLFENLRGCWVSGKIRMVLFDQLKVGWFKLLLIKVGWESKEFEVVGLGW